MDICKFKVVSKRCVFSVCALLILCVCVFLCACDGEDVKDFFQPTDFSITFVLDNGQDSVVWHTGDEVPTPMLDGYKFLYWCVDKERNNRANLDFDNVNLVNSITLYAKWQKLSDFSDLVFESYTVTYDGNAHSLEVENLPDGASVTYSAPNQYVDAGVYDICATVSKEDFNDATLEATLTIEKAQVGDIVMNDKTLTWDGNEHSIYVENDLPQGVSVSYENNAQTEPGVYEVVAHFDVGNNFEPVADKTAKLTINEKTYTILFEDCHGKTTRIVGHGKTLLDVPEPSEKDGYVAVWDRTSFENVTCELQVTAIYTPVEYRVIYNTNGGVVPDEDTIFTIERGAVLHTPQRDYYAFEGWYSDPALQNAVAEIGTGNVGNKNVYAKWRAITYYVTFDLDGGNNNANNVNCDDKYAFTVESETFAFAEPKKTYYDFCGWYLDAEFSEPIAKISKGTHGSFAVYAKWTPQVYSISYDYAGGEKTDNPLTYTHFDNDLILLAPVRAHYDFAGWFNIAGEKIERIASGSCGNIELFARWTATEYSISYNLNGGVQSVSNSTIYTVEDKNITLCAPTKTHYSFDGWFLDEEFFSAVSQIETANGKNLQLYAKWSAVQYTVSFENASVDNIVYTVESESFDLPVAKKLGYTFVGWFANADLSGETVSRIEQGSYGNVTLYAKFALNRYAITYDTQGGVNAVENKTEYTIEDGNITLYAPVRNYYDFAGWYENGVPVESISATRLCNISLVAKWNAVEYTISYDLNGGTYEDTLVTKYTVESENIVLPTLTKQGYTFDGWYASETFDGDRLTEIANGSHGNISLYAKFALNRYSITYDTQGGVNAVGNKTEYTIEDGNITLYAPVRNYYDFAGWYENGVPVESISATRLCNISLIAKWTAVEYTISYDLNGGTYEDTLVSKYTVESEDIILPTLTKQGYTFAGWYASETFDGDRLTEIANGSHGNISLYAKFTLNRYTITYDTQGGVNAVENKTEYTIEDGNITLHAPVRNYYDFAGWYENGVLVESISATRLCNISLVAKWTAVEYTISYDLNGGTCEDTLVSKYTVESEDIILPTLSKDGYIFAGWYASETFDGDRLTEIANGSHGNVTLYAKFALNRYTITYDTQGGVNAVGNKTEYTIEDGNITLYAPVRNYYDFAGWYENGVPVESISANRLCNISLVAKWTAVEYTISYDRNGGTCEDTLVSKYTVESEDIILPTLSKDGCIFAGWYDGDAKVEKIASGSHGDIALLAKWASATYSVMYVCGGEHSNPAQLNVGDDYTLKDAQKAGYSFEGWYVDQSYSDRVYVLTSSGESVTVYAKFALVVYTITYDYDGGTGVENPTTYTVESEDIMLCDATKDGFEFAGWFDQDVKVEKIAKGSHGNLSLVAKWIENSPFVVEGNEIVGYTGSDTHIVLPSKVGDVQITSIGADVFQSVASCVEIIEIEEGITTIAQGVFFNLTKLRIVSLPSTITQMPQKAFKDCVLLEEMTLPFVGATKYKNDEFVGTGKYAYSFSYVFDGFADTSLGSKVNVSAIRFAKDGTNEELTFSEVAYVPTSLKKVTILDGDLIVYAFKNCANIEQIVVKGGGTVVDKQAFAKCTNLASVELAGGFESFGTACFSASGLQTITVHNESQKSTLEKYLNDSGITTITVSVSSTLA